MFYGYDVDATFRAIEEWPGEATPDWKRKRAPFKATWSATLAKLKTELRALAAKQVVIELDMDESQLRRDGYPRANAVSRGPGVILSLESKYGPLRYPCDTFRSWEDNLRAIALALEALRKVDRYGVTKRGEQYTGWKRLPGAGGTSTTITATQAASVLCDAADDGSEPEELTRNYDAVLTVYRIAARKVHPDAGGSHNFMAAVNEAKTVLDKHHHKTNGRVHV